MSTAQSIERFLAELHRQQISVWADGERLRCSGPDTALSPDVTAEIRARKSDILNFLQANQEHGIATPRTIPARYDRSPPLSFAQRRMWFVEQMYPGTLLHHMRFVIEARGPLEPVPLKMAMNKVVSRHAVLRTRIRDEGGEPRQIVLDETTVTVSNLDMRAAPPSEEGVRELISAETARPFDLSCEPPIRLTLVRLADDRAVLVFTLHHIASDGWSGEVLAGDLAAFYAEAITGRPASLPPLPIQYGDFSAWQHEHLNGAVLASHLDYWRKYLGAQPPVFRLPTDFIRPPIQSHGGALARVSIDSATTAALRRTAHAQGATLFATLLTVFNVLLYRYSGQDDLIVGTPVANRQPSETETLVGLFVNPLPIRSQLLPQVGFAANLARIQAGLLQVSEHQELPFERLVEELRPERDPSVHPLFQIKFQFDPARQARAEMPGIEFRRLSQEGSLARLDLSLNLHEADDGIAGELEYATSLFRQETIEAMAGHFRNLAEAIAANPDRPIAGLAMLSEKERSQLARWNVTTRDFDADTPIQSRFEGQVTHAPDAVALIHDAGGHVEEVTYDELNRRANQLAHQLRQLGVGPEVVVGIALERSPEMIAAWLAVLKAGGAYLPLDPAYPAERLATMMTDARVALVLSHSEVVLPSVVIRLNLDTDWPLDMPTDNPACVTRRDHLAYVIYTSGSTGRPKGVLVPHGGLANLTDDKIRVCDVRHGDCILQFFSFSFDASIPELVMALTSGARLLLASPADLLPGPGLARLLQRHGVTHLTMTPSALLGLPAGDYPDLRLVLVGGEAPTPELIARWSEGRTFINAYGPTETTVNASMVSCGNGAPSDATLWPAANKELHVLNEALEPPPPGVPGELYIGGVGAARGYHGRPGLTAEHFLPDPFTTGGKAGVLYRTGDRAIRLADGRIRVLGRVDNQVKIRGYRIELGEIELALLGHDEVASAVVMAHEHDNADKRLVAYVVAERERHISGQVMRAWLRERLPRFMIPDAFVWMDTLPLTVNGKVDVTALPMPRYAAEQSQSRAPSGTTEIAVAEIFAHVLAVDAVSADADFFELGGHSLMATRLVAIALERFGIELNVLDLFTSPTVASLAARIDDQAHRNSPGEAGPKMDDAWRGDVVLAPELRPAGPVVSPGPFHRVFLTGASGFLGAYLLRELLRQPETQVWCHVRGDAGMDRIKQSLAGFGLWDPTFAPRIHPVTGDLEKPDLGISQTDYAALTTCIDTVIHNGAAVKHMLPYERLRAPNVGGTREILRLACAGAGRPLHFISTLSVLPPVPLMNRTRFYEDDDPATYPVPSSGYTRSKWIAEQLVTEAGRRGLPIAIYRTGGISGDSRTGAFNANDVLVRLVQGYIRSGAAPEGTAQLDMLPVDHVARAILHLARQRASLGRNYHLVHSRPVSSDILFEACLAEGYAIKRIPYDDWHRILLDIAREDPDHPLFALVALFNKPKTQAPKSKAAIGRPFDTSNTVAALADAPFIEPELDASLFQTYLRAFARAGAVPDSLSGDEPR
ncbi:amino acid adenylation domain-containing protein [Agrobacterium vitis]|uniref:non-ribosomal peptide synthetase n=1 Tax=Rhizobium/Agrobacterium group TaxID=227290 RepID=UPI0012E7DC1D|nr:MULTISPECIES: non-ribosomal peptide synthetase [Rhizobium/Agrobacterium group]MCF1496236.1 amino acid adenylation domain-containing protein [Allorhizobium ampelinum]MVA48941.1 amino acid adenylation domain-containing protein [Agrobacterium vitis]